MNGERGIDERLLNYPPFSDYKPLQYDCSAGAPVGYPGAGGSYRDNVPGSWTPTPRPADPSPISIMMIEAPQEEIDIMSQPSFLAASDAPGNGGRAPGLPDDNTSAGKSWRGNVPRDGRLNVPNDQPAAPDPSPFRIGPTR